MDQKYWKELIDRYFGGLTTEAEELSLKVFLASPEASDPCFDEARAVMGLFVTGRRRHVRNTRRRAAIAWTSAAAAVILISIGIFMGDSTCIMWEDGVRITDRKEIVASAEDALFDIFSGGTDAEEELGNLFEIH